MGVHLGVCNPGNMWGDCQASHLAHKLASPCFGHEPKVRVATIWISCQLQDLSFQWRKQLGSIPSWRYWKIMGSSKFAWISKNERYHKKRSLFYTLYGGNIGHGDRTWSPFIFGWLFKLSLDNDHFKRQVQDYFHHILGNIRLDSHAFWIEKCSTNLPMNNEYGILWIPRGVHEIVFEWL
jgi:hypothetical protein